jgi:hypothetical protein
VQMQKYARTDRETVISFLFEGRCSSVVIFSKCAGVVVVRELPGRSLLWYFNTPSNIILRLPSITVQPSLCSLSSQGSLA